MVKRFNQEVASQLRRLPRIRADTQREILRQLDIAQRAVLAELATANPAAASRLTRQKAAIAEAIQRFSREAGSTARLGLETAWRAGVDLTGKPLSAVGSHLGPHLTISDRQLQAMSQFTTDRIKDVGVQTVNRINSSLAQVIIGTKPMSTAITEIQAQLDGATRRRAMTIAYTSVGQAYSTASQEAMLAAVKAGAKLGKRWMKSGKLHPRPSHVRAHNQLRRVSEPFELVDPSTGEMEKIQYPRDPKASAGNVINCGCLHVPVLDGSSFGAGVVSIPDDPAKPIGVITPEQRDAENKHKVEQVNDRLARFLDQPGAVPGLRIVTSRTAKPLKPE